MNKHRALLALEDRAFNARIAMSELFARAGASSATLARWRRDPDAMRASTLGKIEAVLDAIEGGKNDTRPAAPQSGGAAGEADGGVVF